MLLRLKAAAALCSLAAFLPVVHAQTNTGTPPPPPSQPASADPSNQATPAVPAVAAPGGVAPAAAMATPSTVSQTPRPSDAQGTSPAPAVSTGAQTVATGGTKVHGTITDPDGAIIPGATISMTPSRGSARTATSGPDGTYALTVTPGTYTVVVTMKGFASYSVANLRIPAVPSTTLDAKLTIGETTQVVNVEASAVQVSVDPDSNASATVLSGKDLDSLSDDPDELQSELTALAGPSAGPNGGQIYVDGFTGGQLPPKSSIREIRINQNPFSAQFDRLGFGRIEVFTKPGTDKFHGSFQVNGNPSFLNTGNPLVQSDVYQPPYHTLFMFGSITGPINKWASFNIGGSHRDIEDDSFTNAKILGTPGSTTPCAAGNANCVVLPVQFSTYSPQVRTDISPRLDLALGEKNVLTTRLQFVKNDSSNQGIGNLTLPSAGYNSSSTSFELQMSDTQTYGSHVINETRGEFERERVSQTPFSTAPTVSVQGAFTTGGSGAQASSDHQDHLELQNYTSIQTKKNFIRLGARLRSNREAQNTSNNTNGAFTYNSLTAPATGADNSYASDRPSQFTRTVINNQDINFRYTDIGLYAESDWKPLPTLTVSYGIRYETQNYLSEHHDWAPRVSFAYGVGAKGKTPKTVIRGGWGIFYERFGQGSILTLQKENGANETIYTLSGAALAATGCSPNNFSACTAATASKTGSTVYSEPSGSGHMQHLEAPYIMQAALGADQQLGKFGTVAVNFVRAQGVHSLAVQNIACNPDPATGICQNQTTINNQFITEGQYHENVLTIMPRVQTGRYVSLFAYYAYINSSGDNSGSASFLSQPGNFHADLGPTSFDVTSHLFLGGSVTLPRHMQLSPFIIGQSGNRYSVTEGVDLNHDNVYNDRPYLVAAGTPGAVTLPGCGTFLSRTSSNAPANGTIVPPNYCTGPSLFTVNLRVAKTWGFGGSNTPGAPQGGGGQHGGPGAPHGGPGGGGHDHGSGGGMFGGGGSSTGQRYNFTLGAQVFNLTDRKNLSTPNGTLTSPYFGQSTQLAGGPYTSSNALMRWSLQASFTF